MTRVFYGHGYRAMDRREAIKVLLRP